MWGKKDTATFVLCVGEVLGLENIKSSLCSTVLWMKTDRGKHQNPDTSAGYMWCSIEFVAGREILVILAIL